MDNLFISTPKGFLASADLLNEIPHVILTDMCRDVFSLSSPASLTLIIAQYTKTISAELAHSSTDAIRFGAQQVSSTVRALAFISTQFNLVSYDASLSDAFVATLSKKTSIEPNTAQVIVAAYCDEKNDQLNGTTKTSQSSTFSLGKVVGLDWRLGMSISSSTCKKINSPFVTLVWNIMSPTGLKHHPMELSIAQFQDLLETFRDIPTAMESH